MSPDAPWPEVRARLEQRLLPVEDYAPPENPAGSDYDLNPQLRPWGRVRLRPAAVLVPVVEHASGPTLLLTRRSDTLAQHAGQVAFPGGRSDPGETPWQTALREAEEEIGLDPAHVSVAGLSAPYETVTGYVVTPVVGFVRPGFTVRADPSEVAEVFEVPFAFALNSNSFEKRFHEAQDGARRWFYAMPYEERLIWGATAGMLRALHDRVFEEAA